MTDLHQYIVDLFADTALNLTYNVLKQQQQLPVVVYNIIDRSNDINCLSGSYVDNVTIQLNIYSKTINECYTIFKQIEDKFTNAQEFWKRITYRETNVDDMILIIVQYQSQDIVF